jgi:oligosaccharide repeat unit polymerase
VEVASASPPASSRLLVTACLLAAAGVGVVVAVTQSRFMGPELLLAALVGLLSLAPLAVRWWQGRFDMFEPLTFVCVIFFLFYSLGPLVHIATGEVRFGGRDFTRMYARGLALVTLPILATWIGYVLPVGRRMGERFAAPLPLTEPGLRALRRWGWRVSLVAVAGTALWLQVSGQGVARLLLPGVVASAESVGGGGQDVAWFLLTMEWLVPAFLVLAASRGFRSRFVQWSFWILMVVMYASLGFRYRILVFMGASAMLYYLKRGRRPRLLTVTAGVALVFIAAGWYAGARLYFRSFGAAGSLSFTPLDALESGLEDTRIFESFLSVTGMVPNYTDYAYAGPFVYPLVLPVPRALWPGKPWPEWLPWIAESFGTPGAMLYGMAIPNFGEYYLAFGWVGVVVGMLLFGILVRALWAWFRTDPRDPVRQAVLAISYIWLLQFMSRGYFAEMVREWCFLILPALLMMWAARRAQRRALAAGA